MAEKEIRETLTPRQESKFKLVILAKDVIAEVVGKVINLGIYISHPYQAAWLRYKKKQLGHCGRNVVIYPGVYIPNPKGVWIGDNVTICSRVVMNGTNIKIGSNTMIAINAMIVTVGHDYESPIMHDFAITKPVEIGENVWIGMAAIILPGVKIGSGAVIGAGAVVTKDVPKDAIVVGFPAHFLRDRFSKASPNEK